MQIKSTKVDINLKSNQIYDKDDDNTIEVSTDGTILYNGNEIKLSYDEILVDDASFYTTTNLSFKEEDRSIVYMTRTGGMNSTCIFEQGKRYKFPYQFPFGTIEIGGNIKIKYSTEFGGSVLNETDFVLFATKEKPYSIEKSE